jgi:cysteinyl-tRNA synthetase
MDLKLYNTLTRSIALFEPVEPGRVTMYTCGPTVYNYAHIGNFRTFLFEDLLRRYLESLGNEVFQIMNLTDVDDRTIKAASASGTTLSEHTAEFISAFFEDCEYLRIRPASAYPRATENIGPMIVMLEELLKRGLAYRGEDGSVYYAVDKFESYGRLSQLEKRELKVGARVASDEYSKDDARDFALWKAATPEDEAVGAAWNASFGRGRPGWHLECSAIALNELQARYGISTLDIHAGGVDLIFPHHENEIAQSEGVTGQTFSRCWLHGEFLTIGGTKMSKRFGNILTARDLREEGVDAAAVRMLCFSTHYRQRLSFSDDALESAAEGVKRLGEFRERLSHAAAGSDEEQSATPPLASTLDTGVVAGLNDDLNAPQAIAAVFTFVRAANRELDKGYWTSPEASAALRVFDRQMEVLDLLPTAVTVDGTLEVWVGQQLTARQEAREVRDFAAADEIRARLADKGIEVEDTPRGPRWRVVSG